MKKIEAQAGLAASIPTRLPGPESIPFVQRRPLVDVAGLAAKAANEVIQTLAEWREREVKASKSFLKWRQPKPDIDLASVVDSLRESITEAYRVSAAACTPPMLDLNEEHMAEIRQLQDKAIEDFCRQILPAVKDDAALTEQIYGLCPALRPAPDPDMATLANLQKRADKTMAAAMAAHEELVISLRELDDLVKEEAQALAGTSAVGSGRIRRQAEFVRYELIRLLERGEVAKSLRIPVARW